MLDSACADILRDEGFRLVGRLDHRLSLTVWWNPAPDKLLQVIVLSVGRSALLKGDKSYHLKSVSADGETWARDIGLLHDYLENHFPELRISFSHFRDVPPELARSEVRRRLSAAAPTRPIPTVEEIARLQQQLETARREIRATEEMMGLLSGGPDLLSGYLHQRTRARHAEADRLHERIEAQRPRLELLEHLQREYRRKGSAAVYTFNISSDLQVAADPGRFRDALRAAVKELTDMDRHQVTQKLGGGRLQIQVEAAKEPLFTWIEQWLGGALTPTQLSRLGPEFEAVRTAVEAHAMVTPDEPIVVEGHVRHDAKRMAAHVVSDVLRRMDKTDAAAGRAALSAETVAPEAMPLALGRHVKENGKLAERAEFPLTQMIHLCVSGTTGGGKSFLARVLVEEAAGHEKLGVLVLDPRNQSIGLLAPEDRPEVLGRYEEFGMDPRDARGFDFQYFAPGLPYGSPLPTDLSELAARRSIVSFKGLDDRRRCALAGEILDAVFDACGGQESERPRLLVVLDEAHLFTRKRLDESAKEAAAHAERAMDRIAREGRKFGIVLAIVTQTMKDFAYDLASVRQMMTTKIFLRNSDREIEYASDVLGDGRLLVQLPTGTALVHNANWGVVRIRVRPPYSKVFELGEAEARKLVGREADPSRTTTAEARRLLDVIRRYAPAPDRPLNMSHAAELAGIGSKRRLLDLIDELERAGLVRTKKLLERGQPRIIELATPSSGEGR